MVNKLDLRVDCGIYFFNFYFCLLYASNILLNYMIGFINKKLRQYYVFSKDIRDKYNIKKENNPKYFTSK